MNRFLTENSMTRVSIACRAFLCCGLRAGHPTSASPDRFAARHSGDRLPGRRLLQRRDLNTWREARGAPGIPRRTIRSFPPLDPVIHRLIALAARLYSGPRDGGPTAFDRDRGEEMQSLKVRLLVALAMVALLATWAGRLALQAQQPADARPALLIHAPANGLGFGSIGVGVTSPQKTITLQNIGTVPIAVQAATASLVPLAYNDFALVSSNCGQIASGGFCTVTPHLQADGERSTARQPASADRCGEPRERLRGSAEWPGCRPGT